MNMSDYRRVNTSPERVFNEKEARQIVDEILSYMNKDGHARVQVSSWWGAGQQWARNRAALNADQREVTVIVSRQFRNIMGSAITNQTDSKSLRGIVQHMDYYAARWPNKVPPDMITTRAASDVRGADVWADETYNRSVIDNAAAIEELTQLSERENLVSSGYMETTGASSLTFTRDEWGRAEYEWGMVTQAQCSATVRHPKGVGSAWVGNTSFSVNRVSPSEIALRAFEKCKQALNPVRLEPGRYQAILEPAATATMVGLFMRMFIRSSPEEFAKGPMFLGVDSSINRYRSKLGLRIIDERLSISHDPAHEYFGTHVAPLHKKVDFVKNGILAGLTTHYLAHLNETSDIYPVFPTSSYRVSGGDTSIEDMISSTKRGLLVARLAQPESLDDDSGLYMGVTRDGLWLIENGQITRAVRNFRWTESPLFALNNVEQIGVEEQVFDPVLSRNPFGNSSYSLSLNNVVVPPLKVNDFSFTSTIDAI